MSIKEQDNAGQKCTMHELRTNCLRHSIKLTSLSSALRARDFLSSNSSIEVTTATTKAFSCRWLRTQNTMVFLVKIIHNQNGKPIWIVKGTGVQVTGMMLRASK